MIKTYPIAETFTSVQGEGVYTGTLMYFIRLAGCNVGRYVNVNGASVEGLSDTIFTPTDFPLIDSQEHSVCETALGSRFLCDTNYHRTLDMTVGELTEDAGLTEHICLTGGEPFLHDLLPIIDCAEERLVHIETSGTKAISWRPKMPGVWITCSPKAGFLSTNAPMVDEWKFVVSSLEDCRKVADFTDRYLIDPEKTPVYLQPVNWVHTINTDCMELVLKALKHYPTFRLSAQLHKYLEVR